MLYEYTNEPDDVIVAEKTLLALLKVESILCHVKGNSSQSLGLLPAIFFYTSKAEFKELSFLLFISWFSNGSLDEIKQRKFNFTLTRDIFEEVWMYVKDFTIKELIRIGSGSARLTLDHLKYFDRLLLLTAEGKAGGEPAFEIAKKFIETFKRIKVDEFVKEYEDGESSKNFTNGVKLQLKFMAEFKGAFRCEICGGVMDSGSLQYDHKEEKARGGNNSITNGRIVHPYCNRHRDELNNKGIKTFYVNKPIEIPTYNYSLKPDTSKYQIVEQMQFEF